MRPFLTSPGEPLLSVPGPVLGQQRLSDFASITGLRPSQIVMSPVCAIPLPLFTHKAGARHFPAMNPHSLWHPMFWLPIRQRGRYRFQSPDGDLRLETDDEWAVRLSVELTMAGLYDETSGQWVDILSWHSIDVDDQHVKDRLASWLSGNPDSDFDKIDLTEDFYVPDDPAWAAAWVNEILPDLELTRWMVWAEDLDDQVSACLDEPGDAEEAHSGALMISELAREGFRSIPDYSLQMQWAQLPGDPPLHPGDIQYLEALLGRLRWAHEELVSLQEAFRPSVEALANQ